MLEVAQNSSRNEARGTHPAIVSTGAGSGMGLEIARMAAMEGSFLLLGDRSCQQLTELVADIAAYGVQAIPICIDVTSSDAVRSIESALSERDLYCYVLVNSAGIGVFGPAARGPQVEQMRRVALNLRASPKFAQPFLPR